tara:strand:- start:214 stop:435 length:222 start_codon:yes stop_codon:yes gene_type:complete
LLKKPFNEKSPVALPRKEDKTSFPSGLNAFNLNSSKKTFKSIIGLSEEKSKTPVAAILLTFLFSIDKSTLYFS